MVPPSTGPRRESRQEADRHQRPPDPAEAADKPLEPKTREGEVPAGADPHHALNNPVGEPDPSADSDPFDPEAEEADPPPPGRYPGPGPEPDDR
jgi:hypothetical protein